MGQPVLSGRDFNDGDLRPDSLIVVVVNQAFVREFLNEQPRLGTDHHLTLPNDRQPSWEPPQPLPIDIIGVVKDAPYPDLRAPATPVMYQTFRQTSTGRGQMVLHVRVDSDLDDVADVSRQVRSAVQAIGIAIGLPSAWLAGRLSAERIAGILFRMSASDAVTIGGATLLLVLVAAAAGFLPVRRAARIDPIAALRHE